MLSHYTYTCIYGLAGNIYIYLYMYVYMKTMCPSGYHHSGSVATHALRHMMYSYTLLIPMKQRVLNKPSKERNISGYK